MLMNTAETRVIDPILSNHARGYVQPGMSGHVLFPRISVPVRGFKVIKFGIEAFRLYATKRAPGSAIKRVSFGYGTEAVRLEQDALAGVLPWEHIGEAAAVPGVDLEAHAVNLPMSSIALGLEYRQAQKARNAALYGADNKLDIADAEDKWSVDTSDPAADVSNASDAISDQIGMVPNTMVIGKGVYSGLKTNPKVQERFKYTSAASINVDMLKSYFDIENLEVGQSVYWDEDNEKMQQVWGNDVILAYVPPAPLQEAPTPSYGYTYGLEGHPFVRKPWFDEDTGSYVYPTTDETSVELVGADAGFLIQNAV